MAALGLSTTIRNNKATQVKNALDADTNPGYFEFYDGTQPATGAAVTTQNKLGTCALSKPCGTVSGGALTFSSISDDTSADHDGTATWLRAKDGAGTFCFDMTVTDLAGAGPCKLDDTAIIAGGRISVASCVLTEGNA